MNKNDNTGTPFFSIIVPVYKVEQYIHQCVDSILSQTFTDFELILVDDGSPDNCPAICDEYAAKDFRVKVIHKANGGLSDARNAGIEVATGEYIVFVDSDDWLVDKDVFESFAAKAKETDCDIIIGKTLISNRINDYSQDVSSLENYLKSAICFSAWNKMYKVSVLKNERFIVGRRNEDMPFTSKLLFSRSVTFVDKNTYMYFQNPASIMHSFSEKTFDILTSTFEVLSYLSFYKKDDLLLNEIVKENCFAFFVFGQAVSIYKNTRGKERKKYFGRFFSMLDEQNFTKDFFVFASRGIRHLHNGKIKNLVKLMLLQYLKLVEFLSRKKRGGTH